MDSTFHLPQQPRPPDPVEDRPACPACGEPLILLRGFSRCLKCNFTICDACENSQAPEDFQRRGIDRAEGPITLVALLRRATDHIPHHVKFIQEKRVALRTTGPSGVLSGRRDIYSANVSSY
jgi:hypothetical protein